MTWPRVYLVVCVTLLAGSVFVLVEGVTLGLSPWPRLLSVALWLGLTVRAWQAVRGEEGNGRGKP